ncbi:MAG: hypothetical protein ACRCX2_39245 [Paraclostridium sp.]
MDFVDTPVTARTPSPGRHSHTGQDCTPPMNGSNPVPAIAGNMQGGRTNIVTLWLPKYLCWVCQHCYAWTFGPQYVNICETRQKKNTLCHGGLTCCILCKLGRETCMNQCKCTGDWCTNQEKSLETINLDRSDFNKKHKEQIVDYKNLIQMYSQFNTFGFYNYTTDATLENAVYILNRVLDEFDYQLDEPKKSEFYFL